MYKNLHSIKIKLSGALALTFFRERSEVSEAAVLSAFREESLLKVTILD